MRHFYSLTSPRKSESVSIATVCFSLFFFMRVSFRFMVYAMLMNSPRHVCVDWAYLEDWCRRLTKSFPDVYVFTIPLYLPQKDKDGKSRVVSGHIYSPL
jgi:DNA/RNA non-specific endonuclease